MSIRTTAVSKEFEAFFHAVNVELAPELAPELSTAQVFSAAQVFIERGDRLCIQEASIAKTAISKTVSASSQRCLAHCWHTDQEWEQGQRCLVACWQNSYPF